MSKRFHLAFVNGMVADGSGAPLARADVGLAGETIEVVGQLDMSDAAEVIDVSSLVVAPGFIDIHTHSDITALVDPRADSKVFDGVTTEIAGNCGYSQFPLRGELRERRQDGLKSYGLTVDWSDAPSFLARYANASKLNNRGFLVGQGTVRACVMGYEDRPAHPPELEEMKAEVAAAMDAGALGISSGLIYPPGCYTPSEELVELCRVAAERGGYYATHMRSEGDNLEDAIEETISIAEQAGIPVQIAHVKTYSQRNWHKIDWLERTLHEALGRGVDLLCDRYPYIAAATDLGTSMPKWVHDGGRDQTLARFSDKATRERIAQEVNADTDPGYWDTVVISSVHSDRNKAMEGKSVAQLATDAGRSGVEFAMELLLEEKCRVSIVSFGMSEDNLRRILSWPLVMVASDASAKSLDGPLSEGKPHPRSFGTFCRALGEYCREEGVFSVEEAVRRMTSLPAKRIGLKDRGLLAPGCKADVTVFDPNTVSDRATFPNPHQHSVGVRYVAVNGCLVLSEGELTGPMPGQLITR